MSGANSPFVSSAPAKLSGLLKLVPGTGSEEREFLPAALEIIETPASPAGRAIGFLIVAAALTGLAWSCVSKVDIITTAPGRIVPMGRSKIIQPFQAGVVQAILVNDGDHVTRGDALIELDPTAAKADALRISQDLLENQLDRSRLEGLRDVLGTNNQPVLVDVPAGATPVQIAAANSQMQAQVSEQLSKLKDIDQQIAEKQSDVKQAIATITKVQTDRPFLKQVDTMRTTLYNDHVGSKLDWLTAQQQLADTGPDIASARAQENSAVANVAALTQSRNEAQAEYAKTVLSDLEVAEQKIGEGSQDLIKAQQELNFTTLRAPISGYVQQTTVHTVGGVVTPAQTLMTIVPDHQQLMVEASVKNQDVGFVHVGQEVEVKIGAFDFTRFGALKGTVVSISRDVVDQLPNQAPANDGYSVGADQSPDDPKLGANGQNNMAPQEPGYVAHIALPQTTIMTDAGVADLQPGMGVTADIKTGRRRVISYLLSPFEHQLDEAGHER